MTTVELIGCIIASEYWQNIERSGRRTD